MIFIVLSSHETVRYTVQYRYCIFSLFYRLLRIRLKLQNPLLSYVREREKVHCKCTLQCTVHFITTLFNVVNVLLCAIYQLKFTIFMDVTLISCYIERSVLSAVSCNRGRSWNVLPMDRGSASVYVCVCIYIYICLKQNHYRPRQALRFSGG